MKKTLFISVSLFSFVVAFSQGIDPHINLGEGKVTVLQFMFPPAPERPATEKLAPRAIVNYISNVSYTYYIKKNKVLLKSQDGEAAADISSTDTTAIDNGLNLVSSTTVKYLHPAYLIDCIKRTACYLSDSTGLIVEKNLSETNGEFFYRNVNVVSPKPVTIVSTSDTSETFIAGKKCFKGLARDSDGKEFVFYYSKEKTGVQSPMNNLLPATFPYTILRYGFPIQWSYRNGTVSPDGLLILQVSEIRSCAVADSTMIPPRNSCPIN